MSFLFLIIYPAVLYVAWLFAPPMNLMLIPALVALGTGIWMGIRDRRTKLFAFAISPVLTHAAMGLYVVLSGRTVWAEVIAAGTLIAVQTALLVWLVLREARGRRLAPLLLAVGCASYALAVVFLAVAALTGQIYW